MKRLGPIVVRCVALLEADGCLLWCCLFWQLSWSRHLQHLSSTPNSAGLPLYAVYCDNMFDHPWSSFWFSNKQHYLSVHNWQRLDSKHLCVHLQIHGDVLCDVSQDINNPASLCILVGLTNSFCISSQYWENPSLPNRDRGFYIPDLSRREFKIRMWKYQWRKQILRIYGPEFIQINELIKTAKSAVSQTYIFLRRQPRNFENVTLVARRRKYFRGFSRFLGLLLIDVAFITR